MSENKSLLEEAVGYTSSSEDTREQELNFLRKGGPGYLAQPHAISGPSAHYDQLDFETPFGKLRELIRDKIRGRGRF